MGDKFDKFGWLKRTDGHRFTGAEFRVLVSLFNHSDGSGREAYPGIDLMVEETGYRRSGVSEAVASLKAKGWIHETYRGNGRAKKASSFDLVPDAPNPGYRCPEDRAGGCSTCSNGSALPEPLSQSNGSAGAELLTRNGSGFPPNGSAGADPIVPLERLPTDPGTDPKIRSSRRSVDRPSDPGEFRYPPEQRGGQDRSLSAPVASAGRYTGAKEAPGDRPESETESVSSSDLAVGADTSVSARDHVVAVETTERLSRLAYPKGSPEADWGLKPVPTAPAADPGSPDPFAGPGPEFTAGGYVPTYERLESASFDALPTP